MLQYFERNVIPKTITFVKGTFSQFEIDDYCE